MQHSSSASKKSVVAPCFASCDVPAMTFATPCICEQVILEDQYTWIAQNATVFDVNIYQSVITGAHTARLLCTILLHPGQ